MSEYFNADIPEAAPAAEGGARLVGRILDSRFGILFLATVLFLVTQSALRVALSVTSGALAH